MILINFVLKILDQVILGFGFRHLSVAWLDQILASRFFKRVACMGLSAMTSRLEKDSQIIPLSEREIPISQRRIPEIVWRLAI
jgi:hypothetical protein